MFSILRYLLQPTFYIRLDDAHPNMNHVAWDSFEELLDRYSIKPIVAVIPDCRDQDISFSETDLNFWERVKAWKAKGWHIGIHGLAHEFITSDSGLVGINNFSEFAGTSIEMQREKLIRAVSIFREKGVEPDLFVAPAHSFDDITVDVLLNDIGVKRISDGFAILPYRYKGVSFIPQQLWRLRAMIFGVWTCCFHPSTITEFELRRVEDFITRHERYFASQLPSIDKASRLSGRHLMKFVTKIVFKFKKRKLSSSKQR